MISFTAAQGRVKHSFRESIIGPRAWCCTTQLPCLAVNAVSTWVSFWHWVTYKQWRALPNNRRMFCLTLEAMPSTLGIFSQASHDLGWFHIFWKGQLSQFIFSGAYDVSPSQKGSHIPLLLRRGKRPSAGRAACHVTASCVQRTLPMARKLGISLHGFLWAPPAGHHLSCFSITVAEVCFTPSCHFSLSYNSVPQIHTLDREPNCILKSVGYCCLQKNVFYSAQEKLTWKQK